MTNRSDDLRQWLPVEIAPPSLDLLPESSDVGWREALKDHIKPVWNQFVSVCEEKGFSDLSAMAEFMQRRIEALEEERQSIRPPHRYPQDPQTVARFSLTKGAPGGDELQSEEQALANYRKQRRADLRRRRTALATCNEVKFRLSVLRSVMYRITTFGDQRRWGDLSEAAKGEVASTAGRNSTLNDPSKHPIKTLNAVLEWTGNAANEEQPFLSDKKPSLCGFVSERLPGETKQSTIKTRLKSLTDELEVDLPHGHTHKLSYFEARESIEETMKKRGLPVE